MTAPEFRARELWAAGPGERAALRPRTIARTLEGSWTSCARRAHRTTWSAEPRRAASSVAGRGKWSRAAESAVGRATRALARREPRALVRPFEATLAVTGAIRTTASAGSRRRPLTSFGSPAAAFRSRPVTAGLGATESSPAPEPVPWRRSGPARTLERTPGAGIPSG